MIKVLAALLLLIAGHAWSAGVEESTDRFGPFGVLHIYKNSAPPGHLTLFISGDGGWNLGVIDMARSLVDADNMVVGIDITHYIGRLDSGREKCVYPAAHFEELSQYLQKKHGFPHYTLPVLVGYSSGATLVYATLAQAPTNTFAGGISIGFCPDLKTAKPLCKGNGSLAAIRDQRLGFVYRPVPALPAPLYVLQGDIDHVCSTRETRLFLNQVKDAELIEIPEAGHGFSVQRDWKPQLRKAFRDISDSQRMEVLQPQAKEVSDLPLVALPAAGSDTLAVIVSGDGGWAGIDKAVAGALNRDGIAVVGLDSLQYFWKKKDPEIAGRDLRRILEHYGNAWSIRKFILAGYSSGADTLPFMASRLPEALKSQVRTVVLLGPSNEANFEFHVSDWLFNANGAYKVVPEVGKLKGMDVLCVYGEDEDVSGCRTLDRGTATVIEMPGGHHFGGDYAKLARIILEHSR